MVKNVHFLKKIKKTKKSIDTEKIICYINTTLREKIIFFQPKTTYIIINKKSQKNTKKVLTRLFQFVIMCLRFEKEARMIFEN